MKRGLLVAAVIGFTGLAFGQGEGMLDNGSFESVGGKPKKLGQIELAAPWVSPTAARADIFLGDNKIPGIGTTSNPYGLEDAQEGKNFAGFVAYSFGDKLPRTYIMAKLNAPMKKGMRYCVKFAVVLAEGSKYACNNIGVNFSNKEFAIDTKSAIIDKPEILDGENRIFNSTFGWDLICGSYTANGGEKYITIGNFSSNESTRYEANKKSKDFRGAQTIAAYYYLDDVSVTLMNDTDECSCGVDDGGLSSLATFNYSRQIKDSPKFTTKQRITEQSVYFGFGKEDLSDISISALDFVIKQLTTDKNITVTLVGHCDNNEYDLAAKKPALLDMDKKRVETVKAYLIEKGIDESRIKTELQANTQANSSEIEEGDEEGLILAKNRRVSFKTN